jgi:hypothetical protein
VPTDSSDNLKNLLDDEWSKAERRLIEKKPGWIRTTKENILSDGNAREHAAAFRHMMHAQLDDRLE